MKKEDLKKWVEELTQDIDFEYQGISGSICPFSLSDISLCYGDKEKSFTSVDALMMEPFFDGKSISEICENMIFN